MPNVLAVQGLSELGRSVELLAGGDACNDTESFVHQLPDGGTAEAEVQQFLLELPYGGEAGRGDSHLSDAKNFVQDLEFGQASFEKVESFLPAFALLRRYFARGPAVLGDEFAVACFSLEEFVTLFRIKRCALALVKEGEPILVSVVEGEDDLAGGSAAKTLSFLGAEDFGFVAFEALRDVVTGGEGDPAFEIGKWVASLADAAGWGNEFFLVRDENGVGGVDQEREVVDATFAAVGHLDLVPVGELKPFAVFGMEHKDDMAVLVLSVVW